MGEISCSAFEYAENGDERSGRTRHENRDQLIPADSPFDQPPRKIGRVPIELLVGQLALGDDGKVPGSPLGLIFKPLMQAPVTLHRQSWPARASD